MTLSDVRRKAQAKSVESRNRRSGLTPAAPEYESGGMADEVGADALVTDKDPVVAMRLREYLAIVGPPGDWSDARTLEQVRGEIIKTAGNALDLQAARGRLVERKELDAMAKKIRDSWWREAQQIASGALADLADLPMDARAKVKTAIDVQVAAAAARVKAEMVP